MGEGVENCRGKASGRRDGGKGERRAVTMAVVGERERWRSKTADLKE